MAYVNHSEHFRLIPKAHTLKPRQNGRHFSGVIFKFIFLYENWCALIQISLKFVPKGPINNIPLPAMVEIMAWCQTGDKPLSELTMVEFTDAYICTSLGLNELYMLSSNNEDIFCATAGIFCSLCWHHSCRYDIKNLSGWWWEEYFQRKIDMIQPKNASVYFCRYLAHRWLRARLQ